MGGVLLVVRLGFALTFAVAGVAKLLDRPGSRQAMEGFHVPGRLVGPSASALPLAELSAAVLLVPTATGRIGAVIATALLMLFALGIAAAMRRGEAPDCHCFGQLHSKPAGRGALIRNVLLGVFGAGVAVAGPGASLQGWLESLSGPAVAALVEGVVLVGTIGAGAWFGKAMLRRYGRLLLRIDELERAGAGLPSAPEPPVSGPAVGSPAPGFALPGLHGEVTTLDSLRAANRPILLVFTDPGCGPCNALAPQVGEWQRTHAGALSVAVISRGEIELNRRKAAEHRLTAVMLETGREVSEAYRVVGTPSAVLVGADGRVAAPLAAGAEEIQTLLAGALAEPERLNLVHVPAAPPAPQPLPVGAPAPRLELRDDKGRPIALDGSSSGSLMLFWNPACGFCERMLPDLRRWARERPEASPDLIVVTSTELDPELKAALGARVAVDERFVVAPTFGISGTPSAVLIDGRGLIASDPAVGGPAVMALTAPRATDARA